MNQETSKLLNDLLIRRESQIAVTGTDLNRAIAGYNNLNIIVNSIIKILQDELDVSQKLVLPKEPVPRPDK